MKIGIVRSVEQTVSRWSGGTTAQLAIYPEDAKYEKRDFLFRISTATVEVEHSNFTSLPGFSRILMVMEGEMRIEHKGRYSLDMYKFDIDYFEGEWETESRGKVRDFNLMMKTGARGFLLPLQLASGDHNEETISGSSVVGLYMSKGRAVVKIEQEDMQLEKSDFILISGVTEEVLLSVQAVEESEIILAGVNLEPDFYL